MYGESRVGLGSGIKYDSNMAVRLLKFILQPKFAGKNAFIPNIRRLFGTKSESLVYSEHGDPEKVLR